MILFLTQNPLNPTINFQEIDKEVPPFSQVHFPHYLEFLKSVLDKSSQHHTEWVEKREQDLLKYHFDIFHCQTKSSLIFHLPTDLD